MENASKALLIAGGVLISIIVISIFYFAFGRISELAEKTEEDTLAEEIRVFNMGFESYNKKLMYGIDVISVLNKAIDNNKKNEEYPIYQVNVKFKYNSTEYSLKNNYEDIKGIFLSKVNTNEDDIHTFKVSAFKCTGIKYLTKGDTKGDNFVIGRIKEITFEPKT